MRIDLVLEDMGRAICNTNSTFCTLINKKNMLKEEEAGA